MRTLRKRALFKSLGCQYKPYNVGCKIYVNGVKGGRVGKRYLIGTSHPISTPGLLKALKRSVEIARERESVNE